MNKFTFILIEKYHYLGKLEATQSCLKYSCQVTSNKLYELVRKLKMKNAESFF